MFVFGSTLFGPEKKERDDLESVEELAKRDAQIARLKNREERLMAELKMTRDRLTTQAQVRENVAMAAGTSEIIDNSVPWAASPGQGGTSALLESHFRAATMPNMYNSGGSSLHLQANNFFIDGDSNSTPANNRRGGSNRSKGPPRAKSTTHLGRRAARRSTNTNFSDNNSRLPRLRGGLDLMPVLTSSGEGVFEVGLNSGDGSEHVLPVFRLPKVNDEVEFVNRIPTEPTKEEMKKMDEEKEDEEMLAAALGLSEEELAEFEMEVEVLTGKEGHRSRGNSLASAAEFGDSTMNLPRLDFSKTL
jgi:hypothetical protein